MNPSVEHIRHRDYPLENGGLCRRFRLEGGDIAPGWTVRDGHTAWCEISVIESRDSIGGFHGYCVTGWAGAVWPAAWPTLFCGKSPGGGLTITDDGLALLGLR